MPCNFVIPVLNWTLCCFVKNILGYSTKCCSFCFRNFKVLCRITVLFFRMYFLHRKHAFSLFLFFPLPFKSLILGLDFQRSWAARTPLTSMWAAAALHFYKWDLKVFMKIQSFKLFKQDEFFYSRYNFFFLDERSDFFSFFFLHLCLYYELSNNFWRDFWIFCQIILKLPDMF